MTIQVIPDQEVPFLEVALKNAPPRDAAMVGLLLYCGLRCQEVCKLTWQDVFFGSEISTAVKVKTSHEPVNTPRLVDMCDEIRELLQKHRAATMKAEPSTSLQDAVFKSTKRKSPLKNRDLERICDKIYKGPLGKPYPPRTFRHTFATRAMRFTNIRVVQQLLGHKSLQSTQIYTHPTSDDCRQAVQQMWK
jgi:integrase/recombinase XerD